MCVDTLHTREPGSISLVQLSSSRPEQFRYSVSITAPATKFTEQPLLCCLASLSQSPHPLRSNSMVPHKHNHPAMNALNQMFLLQPRSASLSKGAEKEGKISEHRIKTSQEKHHKALSCFQFHFPRRTRGAGKQSQLE